MGRHLARAKPVNWYPLKLTPQLHAKVWGGRRLETRLNITLPDEGPWGEAWALHDSCVVLNGSLAGKTLGELLARFGMDILGADDDPAAGMPLLAKFIDAAQWLSIQVHPDDEQARDLEGEARGKTEAWLIVDAASGAQLVAGFRDGLTRAELKAAMRGGALEDQLRYVSAAAGDALYVPAGTVHALGPGLLIYEIQQSSDTTYRLYDWGRVGLDGRPRELHLDKGLRVAELESRPLVSRSADEKIIAGKYFTTWRYALRGVTRELETAGQFQILSCIAGRFTVEAGGGEVELTMGETALIPACLDGFALDGSGICLRSCQASASKCEV